MPAAPIRTVATPGRSLVAVCRKCGKKLGGGFGEGGDERLAKALRRELRLPKLKRSPVRLVETGCMKLCPRRAVAVATSGDPGLIYVIPARTPVGEVAARLGLAAAGGWRRKRGGEGDAGGGDGEDGSGGGSGD